MNNNNNKTRINIRKDIWWFITKDRWLLKKDKSSESYYLYFYSPPMTNDYLTASMEYQSGVLHYAYFFRAKEFSSLDKIKYSIVDNEKCFLYKSPDSKNHFYCPFSHKMKGQLIYMNNERGLEIMEAI